MLEQLFDELWINDKKVVLFFGLRYKKDIYYLEFLERLKNKYKNFSFQICLSREHIQWFYDWYITKIIEEEVADWWNAEAYYCWSVSIRKELQEKLMTFGLDRKNFFSEAF